MLQGLSKNELTHVKRLERCPGHSSRSKKTLAITFILVFILIPLTLVRDSGSVR